MLERRADVSHRFQSPNNRYPFQKWQVEYLNQLSAIYAMLNGLNIISLLARMCVYSSAWADLETSHAVH